jgi:hypothetical protein
MLNPKNAKPEVSAIFQDGRRRYHRKSLKWSNSAIYHPILMKFGTQTK